MSRMTENAWVSEIEENAAPNEPGGRYKQYLDEMPVGSARVFRNNSPRSVHVSVCAFGKQLGKRFSCRTLTNSAVRVYRVS
jgi:hypothetical protein